MSNENDTDHDDDAVIARAVRRAPRRPGVPQDRRAAAFERVHAEWRAATAPAVPQVRGRWRAALAAGLAAGVVAVAVLMGRVTGAPGADVALASVVEGVEVSEAGSRPWQFWGGAARELQVGTAVHAAETLTTGPQGGALLRVGPSLALRVAPQSELRFDAADRVTLLRGQVYVDSGAHEGPGTPLTVVTGQGEVRHLGTRYLVRVDDTAVDVAVREGRVLLATADGGVRAEAAGGETLRLVAGARVIERATLAPDAAAYGWLARIPTPLDIEGKTLGEFIEWYQSETGRRIELAASNPVAALRSIRLSGSVAGMTPDEALDTVAAVSDLSVERAAGRVQVDIAR